MRLPTHVCSLLIAVLFFARPATSTSPSSCWVGNVSPSINIPLAMTSSVAGGSQTLGAGNACMSYCTMCAAGDGMCNSAQIAGSALYQTYTWDSASNMATYAASPSTYINFYSCTTTNCNALNSTLCSTAIPSAISASSAVPASCYVDSGMGIIPITTSSVQGGSVVMPAGLACVRYCLACSTGDAACTSAQIASSTLLPRYSYVPISTAGGMAAMPSVYPSFSSCTTTNCNTPVQSTYCSSTSAASAAKSTYALFAAAVFTALTYLAL